MVRQPWGGSSAFLARGYWNDPGGTAERFSGSLERRDERTFRTGDLGRIDEDGSQTYQLFNWVDDPGETRDLAQSGNRRLRDEPGEADPEGERA